MRTFNRLPAAAAGLAAVVAASPLLGQGLMIDRRPEIPVAGAFEVREVTVDARVRDQVAEVQVTQTFHNPGSNTIESQYLFPIPDDGAIQNFVLLVDGKELVGELMSKEKARRIYEEIVRSKRDPALLEYVGGGLIKTSVFPIPGGADRKVTLRYTKLLKRDGELLEFSYPFGTQKFTAKPIERLQFTLDIQSKTPIKSIYSPSHPIESKIEDRHSARVRHKERDTIPTRDLRVLYTIADGDLGSSVLSYRPSNGEDGYFLLLASPDIRQKDQREPKQTKSVVFVLDRSGSMAGKKIDQARDALKFVLRNLNDGDTFDVVAYDDRVEAYKPELQRYDRKTRDEALAWVENIRPGGSTNINDALAESLRLLGKEGNDRPSYVLFLTDGLPTAGETNELKIAEHAEQANDADARIFSFGVGFDVNARLLDRLSAANSGASEYVKPDDDIEATVARFYSKLTSPALSGLSIAFDGTDLNRTYPRDLPDLFEGGQLVWVGRYRESGRARVEITGKVNGKRRTFKHDVDLADAGDGARYDFVETLWAMRRVGFIIDQIDLNGPSTELTDELVELSKRHGILTPYTSFLADETTRLHDRHANLRRAGEELVRLREVEGVAGVGQRANKSFYMRNEQAGAASLAAAPQARTALGRGAFGGIAADAAATPTTAPLPALNGPGGPVVAKDLEGRDQLVANVRQLGKKTFYQRDGRWIDAEVNADEDAKATKVVQFSDAFFDLVAKQSTELNQYLSFKEPVTVKLGNDVYRIDPPQ